MSVVASPAAAPSPASTQWKPLSVTLTTTVDGRSFLGSDAGFVPARPDAVASDSSSASATNHPRRLVMLTQPPA
jgi:hypothetical protein